MKNLQKRKILVFITLFAIPLFGLVAVAEKQRLSVEASHLIYNWSCLKLDGPYGSLEEADFIQPSLGEEY